MSSSGRPSTIDLVRQLIADDPRRAHRGITHREIAEEIGRPVSAVAYALRILRDRGEVEVTERYENDDIGFGYDGRVYNGHAFARAGNAYELTR